MTVLNSPNSTAVIDVPEELVERYEAAGYTQSDKPKAAPKAKPTEK